MDLALYLPTMMLDMVVGLYLPTTMDVALALGIPSSCREQSGFQARLLFLFFYIRIRKHASRILWIFAYDCMNKSMLVVRALYIYIYIYIYMYIHVYVFVVDIS